MFSSFSLQSPPGLNLCHGCSLSLCPHCRSTLRKSSDFTNDLIPNRTGSSSHSIESSDSAFCDQRLLDLNDSTHQNNVQETLL